MNEPSKTAEELLAQFLTHYNSEYLPLKKPLPKQLYEFTTKCSEELGEVCEAASALKGKRRKIKKLQLDNKTPQFALAEEIMDLMINLLNLAHSAGLDQNYLFETGIWKLNAKVTEKKLKLKNKNETV
mgnify:CR=1 FL=1